MTSAGSAGPPPTPAPNSPAQTPPTPPQQPPASQPAFVREFAQYFAIVVGLGAIWGLMSALTDFVTSAGQWISLSVGTLALAFVLLRLFKPLPKSTSLIGRAVAILTAVVVLAGSTGYFAWSRFGATTAGPPDGAVTISEPAFLQRVPRDNVVFRGTAPGLRSDESIWILTGKISDSNVYLGWKPCRGTEARPDEWVCEPMPVGDPYPTVDNPRGDGEGTAYRVFAMRVNAATTSHFEALWDAHTQARIEDEANSTSVTQERLEDAWSKMVVEASEPDKITNLPDEARQVDRPLIIQRQSPQPAS